MATRKSSALEDQVNISVEGFNAQFASYDKGSQRYLKINMSDLKLHLRDFKSNVEKSNIWLLTLSIVGLWTPYFTSDFKSILGMQPDTIKGFYLGVAVIISAVFLRNLVFVLAHKIPFIGKYFQEQGRYVNTDADKLAEYLYKSDQEK